MFGEGNYGNPKQGRPRIGAICSRRGAFRVERAADYQNRRRSTGFVAVMPSIV